MDKGFPGGSSGKESPCHSRSCRFGRVSWRRKRQPTPVFFAWEIPWTEEPGGLQSWGCKESDTTKHACTAGGQIIEDRINSARKITRECENTRNLGRKVHTQRTAMKFPS